MTDDSPPRAAILRRPAGDTPTRPVSPQIAALEEALALVRAGRVEAIAIAYVCTDGRAARRTWIDDEGAQVRLLGVLDSLAEETSEAHAFPVLGGETTDDGD